MKKRRKLTPSLFLREFFLFHAKEVEKKKEHEKEKEVNFLLDLREF